jgi:hypothetical protein
MHKLFFILVCTISVSCCNAQKGIKPNKIFFVTPTFIKSIYDINKDGNKQLTPATNFEENINTGILTFDGTETENDGQIDPQIAIGGNYVLHASNAGVQIFDKKGSLKMATTLNKFTTSKDCFDPKLFYDNTNKFFGLSVWDGYNPLAKKPMRLMFSETENPTKAWNIYSLPATDGVDGGSIGYGKKWILYRYDENFVLILNALDCKLGKPTNIYKFNTTLGQPAFNQDNGNSYAFSLNEAKNTLRLQLITTTNETPEIVDVWQVPNKSKYTSWPLFSAQEGTTQLVSSGDFNPKNVVIQNNTLWYSHVVDVDGFSGIEWMQLSLLNGKVLQQGVLTNKNTNYIQPTIAINKRGDMAIGFQETNSEINISARAAFRLNNDALGTLHPVINVASGNCTYEKINSKEPNLAWGDYSSSVVDGDNGIDFWFAQTIAADSKVKVKLYRLKL